MREPQAGARLAEAWFGDEHLSNALLWAWGREEARMALFQVVIEAEGQCLSLLRLAPENYNPTRARLSPIHRPLPAQDAAQW